MSLKGKIIALSEEVNDALSKENPLGSQYFLKLTTRLMNFANLSSSLERLEQEERKEVEFN